MNLRKRDRTEMQTAEVKSAGYRAASVGRRLAADLRAMVQRFAGESHSIQRGRRRAEVRALKESGLFDAEWYLATYPDVALAKQDPATHYLENGWREGRNPGPGFCTSYYLRRHADVAELGVNPLIHFIEHGSFEGREIEGAGELPWSDRKSAPPPTDMPPPMPVYRPAPSTRPATPWLRACNIATTPDAIIVDGFGLAKTSSSADRSTIVSIFDDLKAMSSGGTVCPNFQCFGTFPDLADAWFSSSYRLQFRWKVTVPTVIRALQFDPITEQLVLVGEGQATTCVDAIHFDLASPTLPLLLVASGSMGELQGVVGFIFPSLARGGMHYHELIDASHDLGRTDPFAVSRHMESQLRKLRSGMAKPVVSELVVELWGADGTGPMFNRDVRDLLQRVLAVAISAAEQSSSNKARQYLAEAVRLAVKYPVRKHGSKLRLAADMLPSLRILLAEQVEDWAAADCNMTGLIVRDPDPAQPAIRFDCPTETASSIGYQSNDYPMPFPSLDGTPAPRVPAAIRTATRPLGDAEFLFPDLSAVPDPHVAGLTLDWLIDWRENDQDLLAQSITALSFQQGIGAQRLSFLSQPSALVQEVAEAAFRGRWAIYDDVTWTPKAGDPNLTAHLGPGVVLHDPRTSAMLATHLLDSNVFTSSCALISSTKHGSSWRPLPAHPDVIPVDSHVVFGGMLSSPVEMLWRSTYPVAQPPAQLWMVRTEDIAAWSAGQHSKSHLNLLTSRITASLDKAAANHRSVAASFLSTNNQSETLRAKVLVG